VTPKLAFMIGYEGSDPDALVATFRAAGVSMVVDTRKHPTSRRPAFRREALRERLAAGGIKYESRPAFGVPKRVRSLAAHRPAMFQAAYRGVLSRAAADLDAIVDLARQETIALLCFELDPGQCHRSLLADAVAARSPFAFSDLRAGRVEDADDHPGPVGDVRAHDEVQIPAG